MIKERYTTATQYKKHILATSSSTISRCPFLQAKCNGYQRMLLHANGFAPNFRSTFGSYAKMRILMWKEWWKKENEYENERKITCTLCLSPFRQAVWSRLFPSLRLSLTFTAVCISWVDTFFRMDSIPFASLFCYVICHHLRLLEPCHYFFIAFFFLCILSLPYAIVL